MSHQQVLSQVKWLPSVGGSPAAPLRRQKLQRIQVTVPYIGRVLSKNYYKFPNGGTRPAAKEWAKDLANKIRELRVVPSTLPSYRIGIHGHFSSESRPDIQNLFDLVSDAVQDGLNVNDKYFTMVDDDYETGCLKPELIITIEELKGE